MERGDIRCDSPNIRKHRVLYNLDRYKCAPMYRARQRRDNGHGPRKCLARKRRSLHCRGNDEWKISCHSRPIGNACC